MRTRRAHAPRLLTGTRVVLFVLCGVLAVLAVEARRQAPLPGEVAFTHLVQNVDGSGFASLMRVATWIGGSVPMALLTLLAVAWLLCRRVRVDAAFIALTIPARLTNEILKRLIERPRPTAEQVHVLLAANGFAFPSGHATSAVVFFGLLAWLVCRRLRHPLPRGAAVTLAAIVIGLIGLSRIYLGAHWPSDVLGGYAFGGLLLIALITLHDLLDRRQRAVPGGPPTYSGHARRRMHERGISAGEVEAVIRGADRVWTSHHGRSVFIGYPQGRRIKVVVARTTTGPHIITVAG
jgi:undecaprenyl-diphosphatase